jgi:hypothetical protein
VDRGHQRLPGNRQAASSVSKPQIGIIGSLLICTILYIVVSAIATGVVPYTQLDVPDPIAKVADAAGLGWMATLIKLGAIAGLCDRVRRRAGVARPRTESAATIQNALDLVCRPDGCALLPLSDGIASLENLGTPDHLVPDRAGGVFRLWHPPKQSRLNSPQLIVKPLRKVSLTQWIIVSMIAGIGVGWLFAAESQHR